MLGFGELNVISRKRIQSCGGGLDMFRTVTENNIRLGRRTKNLKMGYTWRRQTATSLFVSS
jgi:hypothetical protein